MSSVKNTVSDGKNWILKTAEMAGAVKGKILSDVTPTFSRVGTDSRADLTGRLFIALKGDRHDAHDYVAQAVEKKAAAILISDWREEWRPLLAKASFVRVADTLLGLQQLANYWRRLHKFEVFAITGSNGKTTTKEYTRALLKPHFPVHASSGSFNNHWGLPISILDARPEDTHLVLEMGMNHSGEIRRLCEIAEPNVVVVTTIGRAHVGELGSVEEIAKAKEEIYLASPHAVAVFNADNEWTMQLLARSKCQKKLVFSSFNQEVDVHLRAQRLTWDGLDLVGHIQNAKGQAMVPVLGRQNVVNLMAASCLALAAGLTPEQIWQDLPQVRDVAWGRNQILALSNGARLLFDGYNANPDSMTALLKNLFEMNVKGKKLLIIGDMLELGSYTEPATEELGKSAAGCGFFAVWYVGKESNAKAFQKGMDSSGQQQPRHFLHSTGVDPKISNQFLQLLNKGDLVAAKASRGIGIERTFADWPLEKKEQ